MKKILLLTVLVAVGFYIIATSSLAQKTSNKIKFNSVSLPSDLLKTEGEGLVEECFKNIGACAKNDALIIRINEEIEKEQKSYLKTKRIEYGSYHKTLFETIDPDGTIHVGSPSKLAAMLQWLNAWNKVAYGCYCGRGNDPKLFPRCPIDVSDLDSVCKVHDVCYDQIKQKRNGKQWKSCDPDFISAIEKIREKKDPTEDIYDSREDFVQMQYIAQFASMLFSIKVKFKIEI